MSVNEMPRCARCGREAPDETSDEILQWEAIGPDGDEMICGDCITPAEQAAMDEDFAAIGELLRRCAGCGAEPPDFGLDNPEEHGWYIVARGIVCVTCATQPELDANAEESVRALEWKRRLRGDA